MKNEIYDLIIVGGGPAGASAAVYASRKKLKSILILKDWGGQSVNSLDIQNWIGTPKITGEDLAKNLKAHVEAYASDTLDIKTGHLAVSATNEEISGEKIIKVKLDNEEEFSSRALLVASGSNRRKLTVPGSEEFENKGITYCASCDGPMFSGMDVVVIGGGNAGFDAAAQLLAYTKSVTLLSRSQVKADPITVEKLTKNPNFKLIQDVDLKSIEGDKFVSGLTYTDQETKQDHNLATNGIFVEIGQIPSTDWVQDLVDRDTEKRIIIDPWTNRTKQIVGRDNLVWAAGDCTDILYLQNNIASGQAVNALEDIYHTLKTK